MAWGGQRCTSPRYAYVHESVADAFVAEAKKALLELFGDDPKSNSDYSRIINARTVDRLASLIDPAKVIAGGKSHPKAHYLDPTLLYRRDNRFEVDGAEAAREFCVNHQLSPERADLLAGNHVAHLPGNLPSLPGVFPDYPAPVVRNASFSEYAPEPNPATGKKDVVWLRLMMTGRCSRLPASGRSTKATVVPSPNRCPGRTWSMAS